jgi:hypothetical protein
MRVRIERFPVRLGTPLAIAAGAVLLRVVSSVGFANYDTLYALAWGGQLSRGSRPAYELPIAPTPHPLVEALGVVLSPLGPHGVENVTVALGFLALSACGWVVYALGAQWFGRAAGALAALILLTRVPILSYGVRAYVDVPYLLLVLSALLVEARRRRAGAPVLVLLALAGLLRPEAWVFSGAYWLYLMYSWRVDARVRVCARNEASNDVLPQDDAPPPNDVPPQPTDRSIGAPGFSRPTAGSDDSVGPPSHAPSVGPPSHAPENVDPRRPTSRQIAGLTLLAAAAPLVWALSDLAITGDALWSLTNTQHTAETLHRVTGIGNVPEYIPRRIGEILRPPVLLGAALGGVLALLWLRRRTLLPAGVGVLAVVVFAAFASAGLPINSRYAFLAAAILCVFCGAGVFGWTRLPRDDARRPWWMAGGALVLLALIAYAPAQYRSAHRELDKLARQQSIQDDLIALVSDRSIALNCGPVEVSNHAPIPLLALYLKTSPANVVSGEVRRIPYGQYVDPASRGVEVEYVLDPNDPHPPVVVPPGFTEVHANRSWLIFERCS